MRKCSTALLFLCCLVWCRVNSFHRSYTKFRQRAITRASLDNKRSDGELEALLQLRDVVSANSNATQMLLNLIGLGDRWWDTECSEEHKNLNMMDEVASGFTQVPGCMAKVHLKVDVDKDQMVAIAGSADARVARGMLAFFVKVNKGRFAT